MSDNFRELVAKKFPAGTENLFLLLGVTKNRVTWLLNPEADNHTKMTAEEVACWAEVLGLDRSELIMKFGCGWKTITPNEADQLVREEGMEFTLIPHVA